MYVVVAMFCSCSLAAFARRTRCTWAIALPIKILYRFKFLSWTLATCRAWRLEDSTTIPLRQFVPCICHLLVLAPCSLRTKDKCGQCNNCSHRDTVPSRFRILSWPLETCRASRLEIKKLTFPMRQCLCSVSFVFWSWRLAAFAWRMYLSSAAIQYTLCYSFITSCRARRICA